MLAPSCKALHIISKPCRAVTHKLASNVSLASASKLYQSRSHPFSTTSESSRIGRGVATRAPRSIPPSKGIIRDYLRKSFHSTASRSASTRTEDYLLADVGEGITECEIIKWFVEPDSTVAEFDVLVEVQSDKASVEITSRYAGVLKEHCYKVGEVAKVGSPLCRIEVTNNEENATEVKSEEERKITADPSHAPSTPEMSSGSSASTISVASDTSSNGSSSLATPAVRRIIREHGINIDKVNGTGKAGRITKEDVQEYISSQESSSGSSSMETSGTFEMSTIPLTGTRKAMFKAMSTTWNIPHFGYSDEIDITRLDGIRQEMQITLNKGISNNTKDQVKLTLLPLLLKALSLTLDRYPLFRSTLDEKNMTLIQKRQHCISIALSSPRGLLTPTLPGDARNSTVIEIAKQISTLQAISADRGLTPKEMGAGSTITLSNIGSIGGTFTFPLIPPTGQLVIGAIGRSRLLPRFDQEGELIKALILPVSFSADHRVVEGVELAQFVQDWKELIENPSKWIMQMK